MRDVFFLSFSMCDCLVQSSAVSYVRRNITVIAISFLSFSLSRVLLRITKGNVSFIFSFRWSSVATIQLLVGNTSAKRATNEKE